MFYVFSKPKTELSINAVSAVGTLYTFLRGHGLLLSLDMLQIIG